MSQTVKARYWCAVGYPENLVPNWQEDIDHLLQGIPFAYCIHDKDIDTVSESRKVHVHFILVYNNTTTSKAVQSLLNNLNQPGHNAFLPVQACYNVRYAYDYLIHNTSTALKDSKKVLYDDSERITGNNFDIGLFEQVSQAEKDFLTNEIAQYILDTCITNYRIFEICVRSKFSDNVCLNQVLKGNSAYFERIIKGNYLYELAKDSSPLAKYRHAEFKRKETE